MEPVYRPLIQVAGLHGFIPAWQVNGEWCHLDCAFDIELPQGIHRVQCRLHSSSAQPLLLETSAFEGISCRDIAGLDGAPRYVEGGNCFSFDAPKGEFSLLFTVDTASAGQRFTVRLMNPDRTPPEGLSAVTENDVPLPSEMSALLDTDYCLAGSSRETAARHKLSPWHYHNAMMSAPGSLSFSEETDWADWRDSMHKTITELAREPQRCEHLSAPVATSALEPVIAHETVALQSEPDSIFLAHVLVPEKANGAALLCLHGHGYRFGETIGIDGNNPAQRALIERANYDYARQAARRGYVAITPEFRGFGHRADPPRGPRDRCDNIFMRAIHFDQTVVGLQLCDLRASVDYLCRRPEVDPERIGCIGLSYGGRMTMYLTALDNRIKAAVSSGALNTFKERLAINSSCGAQFLPGLLNYCDTPEIFGLIAPRPLLIELGGNDGCCPEIFASQAWTTIKRIYGAAKAADRLALDVFPGGHRWNGQRAWEWLEKWLLTEVEC